MHGIFGVPRILRRKLRTFSREVMAEGLSRALPRAYARLNKLDVVQFGLRRAIVPFRVRQLRDAGPDPGPDEVVVLSVMRNGMPWLHTFLAHHRELGARRFVILDNGSTDGSRAYLLDQPDVVLLSSRAPYRHYENTFKRYICDRYARDRWCLLVDVDELVAYPGMARRSLAELARFLREGGYTAALTHMLDLFSDRPLADLPDTAGKDLRPLYRLYETRDIERTPYQAGETNQVPDGAQMHHGGVRRRVFGTRVGLTKVSLFFNGDGVVPFYRWHGIRHARLADFSIALLHYPFDRGYRDKVLEAAASGRYGWLTDDEYRAYAAIVRDEPGLSMASADSRRYDGPEQLVAEGFLTASPAFAEWAGLSGRAGSTPG